MMQQFTKTDLNKTLYVKQSIADKTRVRHQIDADGISIGRLAVIVANLLSGKGKVSNCDFWDMGDFVVVSNTEKMLITGNKLIDKEYYTYSGYKGNLKTTALKDMMRKDPTNVLRLAVKGMLPKNKLRAKRLMRLKSFVGTSTKFDYMKPQQLVVKTAA